MKGEIFMDANRMKRELGGGAVFPIGAENTAYAQYFTGECWYQEDGKPARALAAGDVVNIPPEVKHWHGAAVDCWFQHLAVEVPAEGASNEWLEFLPTEDYASL